MGKTKVYGNYGRMLSLDKNGNAFFYMTVTKSGLPAADGPSGHETDDGKCPDIHSLSFFYCCGKVPEYHLGYPLILYGEWEGLKSGKWKLMVSDYEEDIKGGKSLEDFLARECPGVGTVSAEKFGKIGEKIWELAEREDGAGALHEMTGIRMEICYTVASALKKTGDGMSFSCIYAVTASQT